MDGQLQVTASKDSLSLSLCLPSHLQRTESCQEPHEFGSKPFSSQALRVKPQSWLTPWLHPCETQLSRTWSPDPDVRNLRDDKSVLFEADDFLVTDYTAREH